MKKIIAPTVLFAVVLVASFFILKAEKTKHSQPAGNQPANQLAVESQLIFFYGDGCPHCAKVEKYFGQNRIEEKIKFEKKEIYQNHDNAAELQAKAKACGLPLNSIGVPFLWTGSQCIIGDKDIINFFEKKLKNK